MLHIINHDLNSSPALTACLKRTSPGDAVLLIENAVYEARQSKESFFTSVDDEVSVHVLQEDLMARGLNSDAIHPKIQVVDYLGFVALAEQHHPIQSWF